MIEKKIDSLLGEYKTEIESLEREVERFVKKRKEDITDIIENEVGEEEAEDIDEILISVKEYMSQLQNYMEEGVEKDATNSETQSELLDVYKHVVDYLTKVDKFFVEFTDFVESNDLTSQITKEFGVDDIIEPLINLIEKLDDEIQEL